MQKSSLQEQVERHYAEVARSVRSGAKSSCCGGGCAGPSDAIDPITRDLYRSDEVAALPETAFLASLGCGNPTALAELKSGEVVLDLGSGGGIDVLLSARRVGPNGKVYGLDMTDEMLALARENQAKAGVSNVEFVKGTIDAIPLPDRSVDVIISNCVINLAADKDRVLAEAFRVLKPGGRFAVSDIVLERELPENLQRSIALWTGCVAGALTMDGYAHKLRAAGFEHASFEITRRYERDDLVEMARSIPAGEGGPAAVLEQLDAVAGVVTSCFIRARRPPK
jgi:ubiquinone/menaquinone biosynthesis C-methylase UbiE